MPFTEIASSFIRTAADRCILALVLMGLCFFPCLLEAAPGGKTEALPIQKAAPAAVVVETAGIEPAFAMRSHQHVSPTYLAG